MIYPSLLRAAAPAVVVWFSLFAPAAAAERVVDFRYGIPTWHQPLGIPEDWHKPMASERGALLYDFGPGPYVRGLTVVELGAEGGEFAAATQTYLHSPRVPIMRTQLTRGGDAIEVTTFAVAPERPAESNGRAPTHERLDGISGTPAWANPPEGVSPEFRNVAWGITRPIAYRVRTPEGAARRIMLGFCESYKQGLYQRTAVMQVEGAPDQSVDLALNAPHHQPQVFLFDARDADADGWIDLRVFAPQGQDPNATLATIAVYEAGTALTRAELIAGSAREKDRALLRIACGLEARQQPPRTDLLHATYTGDAQPQLTLTTRRRFTLDDGILLENGVPFALTEPRATALEATPTGWRLAFPARTREVTVRVLSGKVDSRDIGRLRAQPWADALAETQARWARYAIPFGRITVGDPALQAMLEASLRTLYQARETIAGRTQFNSSFTLYRGLWAGDAVYVTNLAAHLGDSRAARQTLDALFAHQLPSGIIDELHPQQIYRTTAEVLWAVERDAHLSGDWSYAREKWPLIVRGVAGIRGLRAQTLAQPDAPYHGMLPPGFSDGGILDIGAEYSSVYCSITGLFAAERLARRLGHEKEAAEFAALAREFLAAFDRHRQRDQRRDARGHLYLPVRVGFKGEDRIPQLTQWAFMDAHLNGEGWLPSEHELVRGSLALLESVERQGIPVSMGWMPGGNWAGMGLFYAFQPLILNRPEKVADTLYAAANHASRVGTWVEEQSLVGAPLKLAGDQPHGFAAAMMVHLPAAMLAYERLGTIHLLGAVPREWLKAGAVNRLENYRLGADLTLSLTVSADGRTATLALEPFTRPGPPPKILLHTASLAAAGFAVDAPGTPLELAPGQRFTRTFRKK